MNLDSHLGSLLILPSEINFQHEQFLPVYSVKSFFIKFWLYCDLLCSQSKTSRSRVAKRAGSESSQESLSLPPPSPADQLHLYPPSPADHMLSFPPPSPADPMLSLSSPDTNHTMLVGPSDPMLSMPPPSPVDSLLPTVLGSPPILVSYLSLKCFFGLTWELEPWTQILKVSRFWHRIECVLKYSNLCLAPEL